jgi:hypothetical protein
MGYYVGTGLEGSSTDTNDLIQDSPSASRDLNVATSKYEAGGLPTLSRLSV